MTKNENNQDKKELRNLRLFGAFVIIVFIISV